MPKKKKRNKSRNLKSGEGLSLFFCFFFFRFFRASCCLLEEFQFSVFSFRFKSNLNGTRNYFERLQVPHTTATTKIHLKGKKKRSGKKTKVDSKLGRNHDLMRL